MFEIISSTDDFETIKKWDYLGCQIVTVISLSNTVLERRSIINASRANNGQSILTRQNTTYTTFLQEMFKKGNDQSFSDVIYAKWSSKINLQWKRYILIDESLKANQNRILFTAVTFDCKVNDLGITLFQKKMQKLPLIVIKIIVPKIAWGDKHHLTHLRPMFHFYTPWKLQKTSGFLTFSGRYRNRELVWNRLKLIRKPNRPPLHFLKGKYLVLNFLSSQWESGIIKYGLTKQEFVIPNI